jgi:hypothetical protein
MKHFLICTAALMLSLVLASGADAQRRSSEERNRDNDEQPSSGSSEQRIRGSGEERSRGSNEERGSRNSSNEERGERSSSNEERGNRSSRWGNWGGGNWGQGRTRESRSGGNGGGTGGSGFNEQYGIITERNIFMRDRRVRERNDFRGPSRPPLTPEQTFVLTGVVIEDDEYHAYLEDISRRTIQKMTVGSELARGKIVDMDIDAIAYESNGKVTWVLVGSNLTGSSVGSVSDERVNAALWSGGGGVTSAPAPGAPLPDANNPNLTTEEKMRLRRAMELNPGAVVPAVPNNGENNGEQLEQGGEQPQIEQPAQEQPIPQQPTPQNSGLSTEEQMRLRRQQELGR